MDNKSKLPVDPHNAKTDISIALGLVAAVVGIFRSATVAACVSGTTLDDVFTCGCLCGCPFPAVAPEVDATTGSSGLIVRVYSCQPTLHMVAIHLDIFWHVTSTKNPILFRRQAIDVLRVVLTKPVAVGYCI